MHLVPPAEHQQQQEPVNPVAAAVPPPAAAVRAPVNVEPNPPVPAAPAINRNNHIDQPQQQQQVQQSRDEEEAPLPHHRDSNTTEFKLPDSDDPDEDAFAQSTTPHHTAVYSRHDHPLYRDSHREGIAQRGVSQEYAAHMEFHNSDSDNHSNNSDSDDMYNESEEEDFWHDRIDLDGVLQNNMHQEGRDALDGRRAPVPEGKK